MWKPEIKWIVERMDILTKPKLVQFGTTNEVSEVLKLNSKTSPVDITDNRVQRSNLILKDPAYIFYVRPYVLNPGGDLVGKICKYRAMLQKRVSRGKCFKLPFIGKRPYRAYFSPPREDDEPADYEDDVGPMLFGLNFSSNPPKRVLQDGRVENGVVEPDPKKWNEVYDGVNL